MIGVHPLDTSSSQSLERLMFTLLSPAKNLDESPSPPGLECSEPELLEDACRLIVTARRLSQKRLVELMGISAPLAKLNYDRYRSFEVPFTQENAKPSSLVFHGEVYRGLDASSLDARALLWAQSRVGILSGLYGILRPLDLVQPYRLEMGTRLANGRGRNLYEFWGDRITRVISDRLEGHEDPTLVNLASLEYFKSVRPRLLYTQVVTPIFHDVKEGKKPGVIAVLAKRARGLMTRFIIENRIDRVEGLKDFAVDRYRFQADHSDGNRWVFSRPYVSVADAKKRALVG